MRERERLDGFSALLCTALLVGIFSIGSTALAVDITQPPSAFDITTDGIFTVPEEWSDVTPAVRLGGASFVYTSTDPGLGALYLMYDLPTSTDPLPFGATAGPVHFHNAGSLFEVFFICPSGITVSKDGVPFDVTDPTGGEDSIEGTCGFAPSPNAATPHNMFELEVLFDGSDPTLDGHSHGQYSPDPSHWGAGLPTDPNQTKGPTCEERADPGCDENNDPIGPGTTNVCSFGEEVSNACVNVVRGSGGLTLITGVPEALDHFVFYGIKPTLGGPRFQAFGPVQLTDQLHQGNYIVRRAKALGVPANKNDEGISDVSTHLKEYKIARHRPTTPRFTPIPGVQIVNQCNDLLVEVKKPVSILLPTSKDLALSVPPPDPALHNVDHFLCYKAKGPRPFPKRIQVDVVDQFQSRRYDLKKITKLCNPVAKDVDLGNPPVILSGDNKGTPVSITPATIRNPLDHLVCYKAKRARRLVPQAGCGPVNPDDRGTRIQPAQAKHQPVIGIFLNNQFGEEQVDTKKELELCIPSEKFLP